MVFIRQLSKLENSQEEEKTGNARGNGMTVTLSESFTAQQTGGTGWGP